jgi:phosphatidate cytidylyltransferase
MTLTRVLTALVLIPIVIAIVLFTPTWTVALATAVITVLALHEFFALGDAIGHRAYYLWTIFCSLLLLFFQFIVAIDLRISTRGFGRSTWGICGHDFLEDPSLAWALLLFILGLTVLTLFPRRPLVESLPSAGISSSALLLVAFPLSFAIRLHGFPQHGPILLLFALAITWAADTTAYFVGRAIGKHPLAPHISPKKTWEGSAGGILGSLLIAYAFHPWLPIPIPHLLAMGAAGNIAGQMGDLLESACKRSAGVKDSGHLLPGHGGILDRIDALILAIPVIWYYLVLVNPLVL